MNPSALDALYTEAFYAENHRNRHQYDALGDAIHAVLEPGCSVVELGCGSGLLLARLRELGHERVCGFEGSAAGVASTEALSIPVLKADLATAFGFTGYDVLICIEVAEHLPASAADHLVRHMTPIPSRSYPSDCNRIVWSAAPPGQGGVDHVNEQPPGYWLDKFRARGWYPDSDRTHQLRHEMRARKAQHHYAAPSFYVLSHDEALTR